MEQYSRMKERKGIPETDEEAKEMLLGNNPSIAHKSACGIYEIKRKQGMGIVDAYIETLNDWIEIGKRGTHGT